MPSLYKKVKGSKGGFTLIELIVVIAILAIIAVILIPTIGGQIQKARHSAAVSDAQAVYSAAQLYATQYEIDHNGTTLTAKSYTGTDLDQFTSSPAFSSFYDSAGHGYNGLEISSIVVIDGGTVQSVTIHDNNMDKGSTLTYPEEASTSPASSESGN